MTITLEILEGIRVSLSVQIYLETWMPYVKLYAVRVVTD